MEYIRKQITLPKSVERRYEQLAKENGKDFSEYIGEILKTHLKFLPKKKRANNSYENLRSIIGICSGEDRDWSINHDKYLYEESDIH